MKQVSGWSPPTEDKLKLFHLKFVKENIGKVAEIIAQKDMMLARAVANRCFYIGDNPVSRYNMQDHGRYGNLGISQKGVEIYLPLSSDLMLCALCPSIATGIYHRITSHRSVVKQRIQAMAVKGLITFSEMSKQIQKFDDELANADEMHKCLTKGSPLSSGVSNMDFYNSLQMQWAKRYVIDKNSNFKLARRHNKEFPELRNGRRLAFD